MPDSHQLRSTRPPDFTDKQVVDKLIYFALQRGDDLLQKQLDRFMAQDAITAVERDAAHNRRFEGRKPMIRMVRPLAEAVSLQSTDLVYLGKNIDAGHAIGEAMLHIVDHKADGKGCFSNPKLFGPFDCQLEFAWAHACGKDSLTIKVVARDGASAEYAGMASELLEGIDLD